MKTIIPNIIKKYPKPDQTLLPKINLVWGTAKGRVTLDCATGIKYDQVDHRGEPIGWTNMKHDELWVSSGATIKYAYCKYHSKAQLCEFAVVTMDSRRTGGARCWEYAVDGERYFINKNKQIFAADGTEKNPKGHFKAYKYHNSYGFLGYLSILQRCSTYTSFMNEFKKMIGSDIVVVGNGRCMKLEYPWNIQEWIKAKSIKKSSGKVQKLLDELTSLPHQDLSDICKEYAPTTWKSDNKFEWAKSLNDVIYFECLNENWSVLRYCYRKENQEHVESYRVYISEDGDCKMAKLNDNDEWVPAQNIKLGWRASYGRIVNFNDMAKCKRLSYIMPIVEKMPPHEQMQRIVSIIKFPEIEKICKMGYDKLADKLLLDNTVNANIKHYFGKTNAKAKNIFGEFGLNKYQFELYQNKVTYRTTNYSDAFDIDGCYYNDSITLLKKYFGEDISSMDNATFDSLLWCTAFIRKNSYRGADYYIDMFNIDGQRYLKNIARLSAKSNGDQLVRILSDAFDMYHRLEVARRPDIDWIFDSYSDVVRVHDALVEIKRIQDEERRAMWNMDAAERRKKEDERRKKEDERRKKVDEKRKCYEYEEDEYLIRLPKDCDEIVKEGMIQHICIGGYTGRHSEGSTNLFFLRQKDNADVPFYAIEMDNTKNIVQIHGFGNKWLGNDPEAIPTVVRWLRKNNIHCDDKILLCTAKGYSSNREYIAMPKVD